MNAIFSTREAYERFVLDGVLKLAKLMTAALLWQGFLTLLFLALAALWALGVTGTEAASALRTAWQSSTSQVLLGLGVSVLTLCAVAWWTAKKLHQWLGREVVLQYLIGRRAP